MPPSSLACLSMFAPVRRHAKPVPAYDELWQIHIFGPLLCDLEHVSDPKDPAIRGYIHYIRLAERRLHFSVGLGHGLEFR